MKIFLDTADRKAIEKFLIIGIIDGITTNPTNLSKEGNDPIQVIKDICQMLPGKDISVEITEHEPKAVYDQALHLVRIAKNVVVKIPCHADYYEIINKLVGEGIKINITLVFTLAQSLFMSKLGVQYISPFVGRWDDIGVLGSDILMEIRQMLDHYGYKTLLLAASLRDLGHLKISILSGADVATVSIDILQKALNHPLTNLGMEKFSADWQKLGLNKFP